jgi:hypothetical protein
LFTHSISRSVIQLEVSLPLLVCDRTGQTRFFIPVEFLHWQTTTL